MQNLRHPREESQRYLSHRQMQDMSQRELHKCMGDET